MLIDKNEAPSAMEPLIPEEASCHRGELNNLALELATKSAALTASLREPIHPMHADFHL